MLKLETCDQLCKTVDFNDREALFNLVSASIGTKFSGRWGDRMVNIAIEAVKRVLVNIEFDQLVGLLV